MPTPLAWLLSSTLYACYACYVSLLLGLVPTATRVILFAAARLVEGVSFWADEKPWPCWTTHRAEAKTG